MSEQGPNFISYSISFQLSKRVAYVLRQGRCWSRSFMLAEFAPLTRHDVGRLTRPRLASLRFEPDCHRLTECVMDVADTV